jgi:small GTP-binding protein
MKESEQLSYDVFLSHSTKDKDIVRPLAERLKADGVRVWFDEWEIRPGDSIPAKIEDGLERSRVLALCMSANAFGSDWAQLEAGTFRFRDPLNKERRFIPLRFDDAPIKGTLAQFLYIDWRQRDSDQLYAKLMEACQSPLKTMESEAEASHEQAVERVIKLDVNVRINAYAFSHDGKRVLTGEDSKTVRLWDVETGRCLHVFEGHTSEVNRVVWSANQRRVLSCSADKTIRLWNVETGRCLHVFVGHSGNVDCLAWSADSRNILTGAWDGTMRLWDMETGSARVLTDKMKIVTCADMSADQRRALSGSTDNNVRLWDMKSGRCLRVLRGHTHEVRCVAWSPDQRRAISGSYDQTVRLWDVKTGRCLRVLEGHTSVIKTVTWITPSRALSGSTDNKICLWDLETGRCLRVLEGQTNELMAVALSADRRRAFSGDSGGEIRVWNLSVVTVARAPNVAMPSLSSTSDQVQYTNAKVLLVGDTSSGKTGLAHRLASGKWKPSDGSTVGAWSTQWPLSGVNSTKELDREIWLWDFGGQADQRLVHQLYMDHTAMILLLFDADKEDVLPGLRDWQTALRRCVPESTPLLLVAGRIDAGFRASRARLQRFAEEQGFKYFETSSQDGTGCDELVKAIKETIPWKLMEQRTSPRIFKLIKDQILKLRDEGQVLHTFKELRDLLCQRMTDEQRFSDDILKTVIGLLDGPGAVKELEYGTYILLQPEWINAYAQAVIRTLRQEPSELGCLPLRSIAEGNLLFQTVERDGSILEMKRLPGAEERVVLREMERQMEERGLCLRQGDKLVFPSHCGRERPAVVAHPESPPELWTVRKAATTADGGRSWYREESHTPASLRLKR